VEVKEAIVWIKNIPKIHLYIGTKKEDKGEILFTNGVKDCTEKEYYKDINSVISLLQQGEAYKVENVELKAYKQIVKKLKEKYGDKRIEFSVTRDNEVSFIGKIKYLINDYEQKYLKGGD